MAGPAKLQRAIEHRLTKPNHPWSSKDEKAIPGIAFPWDGPVDRMNRTIKDATVKRFHHDSHDPLRTHLADFLAAYNFARGLGTLGGLTPHEQICKLWTSEPHRLLLDPIHQMPGLKTWDAERTPWLPPVHSNRGRRSLGKQRPTLFSDAPCRCPWAMRPGAFRDRP